MNRLRPMTALALCLAAAVPTAALAHGDEHHDEPAATTAPAAEESPMDHSAMDHGAMDHAAMGHALPEATAAEDEADGPVLDLSAPDEGAMDHSTMDHSAMDHGAMDHGSMDHSTMDHSTMDQGAMDHSTMDHSAMGHGASGASADPHAGHVMPSAGTGDAADTPGDAPPPPAPTDFAADAIFGSSVMAGSRHHMYEHTRFEGGVIGVDMLEYRSRQGKDGYAFEGSTWVGGDIDRAVLGYEGEGSFGESPESIEVQGFWRHAINPWFNLQLGARHDFRPDPERSYAMVGIEGLAPYWIETQARLFVSDKGDVHARLEAAYDQRITQRLVLEPEVEIDLSAQDVPELGIGKGIEKFELAARLRYEIARNFAPYVGVHWERKVGDSADYARAEGEDVSATSLVTGLRFWF